MGRDAARWGGLLWLALAACTSLEDVGAGTTVTCGSAGDCPGGRICSRGRCVNPDVIDTTPPDLVAGSVAVSPARVRAGQTLTVRLQVSEPLEVAPAAALGLVPPVLLDCAVTTSAVAYACTYTATGHENGDLGGDVAVNVRMRDVAGNDTDRSSVATVTFDFAPPSPTIASVAYDPAPSNPLASVTRATAGTRVRVAVSADERLSATAPPSLVARQGGATLPFTLTSGGLDEVDAVFATTVPAGQPDGDYALEVAWTDAVGNLGTATVPETVVKVKTSRPALSVNQAAVVFVRSPWGNASPEDLGGHTIPAGAYFALDPPDPLSPATCLAAGTFLLDGGVVPERIQVRTRGQDETSSPPMTVGTLRPGANGTWPRQPLASPDTFTVEVVGYDDAGNASDPQAIATVEWVATSNLPPTGTTPHTLRRTPLVEASRVQRTEVDGVAPADVAGADGGAAVAAAQGVWRKMTFAPPPGRAIDSSAVAYDAARGRVVMFGGRLSSSLLQATSEWDGRAWIDVTPPSGNPVAREDAAMAYDGARGRVVLFGGSHQVDFQRVGLQDTWEWDGLRWTERKPTASPPARAESAMTYDSARGRVVLFGGRGDGSVGLDDTWEWDGASWTSIAAPASPSARAGHSLVYDHARGRSVLFGGAADGLVWEWDGTTWTSTAPTGSPPSGAPMIYAHDGTRGRATVLGAWSDGAGPHGSAWEWDGASWTTVSAGGDLPPAYRPAIAYDVVRARALLNPGYHASGGGSTWEWDGAWWTSVTPTGAKPPPRYMYENALAYDASRRRMVLWGGSGVGDTWEWDGANWTRVALAAGSPPQWSSGLAYDAGRQRTFALSATQTWAWDGASWTSLTPAHQADGALVYDGARQALLAVASRGSSTWTGADWVAMPAPEVSGLAVFDAARGRVVVYHPSGSEPVWEWDGVAWTTIAPAGTTPPARSSAGLAFDSERGRAVLFGGMGCGSVCQDTWEWDGTSWRDATPAGTKPQARRFLSLTYDPDRHRTVLFSGNDVGGDVYWDDTWELEARPVTRPAIQLDVSTARTGIAPGAVRWMRVRANAGGAFTRADVGATGAAGATLRGWTTHSVERGPGGWVPLATNDAGLAAAPPFLGPPTLTGMRWDAGAAEARRFITERDGQASFQVVPSGTMGADPGGARVALDYLEVRIRYSAVP